MNLSPGKYKSLTGVLHIEDLVIPAKIGVSEEERSKTQDISINLRLVFKSLPEACVSDNISETICYHNLCDTIREYISNKEFKLLERISREIFDLIQELDSFSSINLSISKKPNIECLKGSVSMEIRSN